MATVQIENLGTAASGFPVNMAEQVGGHLYIASLGLEPPQLAVFDLAVRRVVRMVTIPTGRRTWAMAAAGDDLYVGMWGQEDGEPNFYRLATGTATLTALPVVRNRREFWALAAAPDGTVYAGTDRRGVVAVLDPRTGALSEITYKPAPGEVTALAATDDVVYAGAGRRSAGLVAIDRANGRATDILPSELAGAVGVYALRAADTVIVAATQGEPARIAVMERKDPRRYRIVEPDGESILGALVVDQERIFASGMRSGHLYEYGRATGELHRRATPVANAPVRRSFRTPDGVLGVSAPGLVWEHDLGSGTTSVVDLASVGADAAPERPQSLAVARTYFAVGTNNAVVLHDLEDGDVRRRVIVPGEPKAMAAVGDTLYMAMYPNGDLWRYDPADEEPRLAADWPDVQSRPRSMVYDPGAKRMLVGVLSDFAGGGALVMYEPAGDKLRVHTDPLSGRQAVDSVTYFEGAAILGGRGTDARLASVDPSSGKRSWEIVPAPGKGSVTGLAVHGRHIYGLTTEGDLFVVDARSRQVLHRARVVPGAAGELAIARGHVWASSADTLVRIVPGTFQRHTAARGLAMAALGRAVARRDADGRVYVLSRSDVVRVTLQAAAGGG